MRMFSRSLTLSAVALGAMVLGGCWERPPIDSYQRGYRGTAMVEFNNPRDVPKQLAANKAPEPAPAAPEGGPTASTVYKNVQVLGNLSVSEFTRTMVSLTSWVAPNEGCNYCHKPGEDLSSDALYTKVVSRKMLQMTQAINSENKAHVGATGVTCYTCHRGQHIPANVWFTPAQAKTATRMMGGDGLQNKPGYAVGLASLPSDGLTAYLSQAADIRVAGTTPLPMRGDARNRHTTKQTEWTYSLMVHMSEGLGVNCTYCHNSRSFSSWETSTPQRVTAWHGIRMARNLNNNYMEPLTGVFPADRKGPTGDVAKINCATCHQGAYKPLFGAQMAKHYPALLGKIEAPVAAAAPVAVAPVATIVPGALVGKVLFATGKTTPDAENQKLLDDVIAAMKANPDIKVDLSGFADKTGNPAKNLELAKQRALSVRDALKTAGVDAARIQMKKPEFAVGGVESDARRVDIVGSK
jgi:photosynthetic reaction center cytochrome c subunit